MRFRTFARRILTATLLPHSLGGLAQQPNTVSLAPTSQVAAELPNAPSADLQQPEQEQSQPSKAPPPPAPASLQGPFGPLPPVLTATPLTSRQRFTIYVHETYGPPAVLLPAIGAAIRMARPPDHYPRDWRDGAEAYGRNYGSFIAAQTTQRTAKFITEVAFHEDPRYLPALSGTSIPGRIFHAVGFTFVDRDNDGRRRLAFSNYTSAGAGGFVGMAYLPDGYNDVTHGGQRAATQFLQIGVSNIAREFAPELAPLIRKLHLPQVLPPWWVPDHSHGGPPRSPPNQP